MFGHAKGAFTGATDRRLGKFAAADRGTLLIDEIGEMALPVQAKLLRTLETRTINPVGSNDEQPVDVRVVAATHRDLRSMVETGTFRGDLYYRLHVVHIHLPPLRQRRDDIPLLVAGFLDEFAREHGRDVREVTPAAMNALRAYHWPGNVRELRNVLEGAVVLSRTGVVDLADLTLEDVAGRGGRGRSPVPPRGHPGGDGAGNDPAVPDPHRRESPAQRRVVGDQHPDPAAQDPRVPAGGPAAPALAAV